MIWLSFHSMQQAIPIGVLTLLCCGKQLRRASGGICLKKYEQLSRRENSRSGMNIVMHDLMFAKSVCLFLWKQMFVIHRLRIIWLGWFKVCAQPIRGVREKRIQPVTALIFLKKGMYLHGSSLQWRYASASASWITGNFIVCTTACSR